MILHELGDLPFEQWYYNAEYAQNDAEHKSFSKGPDLKLGKDWRLVRQVSQLVKERYYGLYTVIQHFQTTGWPSTTRICEKTLYSYIAAGDITDVSEKNLLLHGKRRKPRDKPARHSRAADTDRSIATRPEEINTQSENGHWEMDTVYSGKGCSPAYVLTLTERKSRVEIAKKLPDRTAASVNAVFDAMERQIDHRRFCRFFKSITAYNDTEFSDIQTLERSALCPKPRIRLYFAHPYCSSEQGANENHNGILHRFMPKASDIGLVSKKTVRESQDWMNTYPRKILKGLAPLVDLVKGWKKGLSYLPSWR